MLHLLSVEGGIKKVLNPPIMFNCLPQNWLCWLMMLLAIKSHVLFLLCILQGCQEDGGAYRSIGSPNKTTFYTDDTGLVSIMYGGGNGERLVEC